VQSITGGSIITIKARDSFGDVHRVEIDFSGDFQRLDVTKALKKAVEEYGIEMPDLENASVL